VVSTSPKEHVTTRPKDLPYGEAPVVIRWHKRRWRCVESACARRSFTESIPQVPFGARLTGRLRKACAAAVESGRAVSEVARCHRVSWPTVQKAVDALAAQVLGEPAPTPVLGIDETRFGSPRWVRCYDADGVLGWRRTDPWETGFVDLTGRQGLLGQVSGRRRRSVVDWLTQRSPEFRAAIRVVALDPSAPYASAVRAVLPHAAIAVDPFHLVLLANTALTRVRQRVTREQLDRRGHAVDPVWANRRLLLRGRERPSEAAFARMWSGLCRPRPDRADPRRLDRQRGTARAASPRPRVRRPERDPRTGTTGSLPGAPTSRTSRRSPPSPRPSTGGGPSCSPRSGPESPTPAPKASTGSSNR
jgi:transposase